MSKVEFHTEQNERVKIQMAFIVEKFGPNLSVLNAAKAASVGKTSIWRAIERKEIGFSCTTPKCGKVKGRRGKVIITAYDLAKWIEKMRDISRS